MTPVTRPAAWIIAAAYSREHRAFAGSRGDVSRAMRRAAASAAHARRAGIRHAPPYPVPVATWCGRAWS